MPGFAVRIAFATTAATWRSAWRRRPPRSVGSRRGRFRCRRLCQRLPRAVRHGLAGRALVRQRRLLLRLWQQDDEANQENPDRRDGGGHGPREFLPRLRALAAGRDGSHARQVEKRRRRGGHGRSDRRSGGRGDDRSPAGRGRLRAASCCRRQRSYCARLPGFNRHTLAAANSLRIRCEAAACFPPWNVFTWAMRPSAALAMTSGSDSNGFDAQQADSGGAADRCGGIPSHFRYGSKPSCIMPTWSKNRAMQWRPRTAPARRTTPDRSARRGSASAAASLCGKIARARCPT